MSLLIQLLIVIIAVEHLFFLYLEMFAWESMGKRIFKKALPGEMFKPTKVLAANQGLYNGFLAIGLVWTFFIEDPVWRLNISLYFLTCVSIAGIYGAISADKKIFLVQGLPAVIAILLLLFFNT